MNEGKVREGYGIFLNKGGNCIYEGYWKNSKRAYKGREIWLGYGAYDGEFEDNMK